jgi:hypothetical protein
MICIELEEKLKLMFRGDVGEKRLRDIDREELSWGNREGKICREIGGCNKMEDAEGNVGWCAYNSWMPM